MKKYYKRKKTLRKKNILRKKKNTKNTKKALFRLYKNKFVKFI